MGYYLSHLFVFSLLQTVSKNHYALRVLTAEHDITGYTCHKTHSGVILAITLHPVVFIDNLLYS